METNNIMTWGTGGSLDYLVCAINGPIGLSIKFYGIQPGHAIKVPEATGVVFRVRASDVEENLEKHGLQAGPKADATVETAWPAVTFSKGDPTYRSTSMTLLLPVSVKDGPQAFIDAVEKLDVAALLRHKLVEMAAGGTVIVTREALQAYLDTTFGKVLEQAKKHVAQIAAAPPAQVDADLKAKVGSFVSEAEVLATMAKSHIKEDFADGDGVNDEDVDGDGEED